MVAISFHKSIGETPARPNPVRLIMGGKSLMLNIRIGDSEGFIT